MKKIFVFIISLAALCVSVLMVIYVQKSSNQFMQTSIEALLDAESGPVSIPCKKSDNKCLTPAKLPDGTYLLMTIDNLENDPPLVLP